MSSAAIEKEGTHMAVRIEEFRLEQRKARVEHIVRTGGPAFPVTVPESVIGDGPETFHGMTLRDWFAGQALVGILAKGDDGRASYSVGDAYEIADEMLAHRHRSK